MAIAAPPSHTRSRVYLDPKWHSAAKKENEQGSTTSQTAEEFLPASSQIAMKEPISELTHQPAADIEGNVKFCKTVSNVYTQVRK